MAWEFWIDRGGTFTDVLARAPDGRLVIRKLSSEDPACYDDAAVQGIRDCLGLAPGDPIADGAISAVKLVPRSRRTRCWNAGASGFC